MSQLIGFPFSATDFSQLDGYNRSFPGSAWKRTAARSATSRANHLLLARPLRPSMVQTMNTVEQIEQAIERLDVRDQIRLVKELPAHISIPPDDIALLQLAESAFTFRDNPDDAAYDTL